MNTLKGLILKDFLQLKMYRKTIILYIIVFAISSKSSSNSSQMLLALLPLIFGMFAIASFNYDAISKADKYILALPTTKKEVVRARYIFIMLATFVGALVGILLNILTTYIYTKTFIDVGSIFMALISSTFVVVAIQALYIPFIYKFGPEKKGRIISLLISIVFVSLAVGVLDTSETVEKINEMSKFIISTITFLLALIVYYISYKVSCMIYNKTEQ